MWQNVCMFVCNQRMIKNTRDTNDVLKPWSGQLLSVCSQWKSSQPWFIHSCIPKWIWSRDTWRSEAEKKSHFSLSRFVGHSVADILATISLSCHILSSTSSFLQTQHNGLQMMFFHPGCLWKQTVLLQTKCPNGGGLSKTCFYYILKVPPAQ